MLPLQMSSETVSLEIEEFERNLDRQGISLKKASKTGDKPKYEGTPTEVLLQMQKDSDANAKTDYLKSKSFLNTLKGKDVDASYARIDRDKRKAKQAAEEVETAKKTKAALLGEQFLLELLQIDIKQREEEEAAREEWERKEKERKARAEVQAEVDEKLNAEYKRVIREKLYPKPRELTPTEIMQQEDERARRIRERDNYLTEKAAKKAIKHYDMCRPIVYQIVDLALYMYDYREITGLSTFEPPVMRNVEKAFLWGEELPPLPKS